MASGERSSPYSPTRSVPQTLTLTVTYICLLWFNHQTMSAPVSMQDPVANACAPLCSEETEVEVHCAERRGCYAPRIVADPELFTECWKDCWSLAGTCFTLCADNFDSILGECYSQCRPKLTVDCIAGCFDVSFLQLKQKVKLNQTDVEAFNSTETALETNGTSKFTEVTLDNGTLPTLLSEDPVNDKTTGVVVLELLGRLGPWHVYKQIEYFEADAEASEENTAPERGPVPETRSRSRQLQERVHYVEVDQLKTYYRGPDGLFRKQMEYIFDKELWELIIADYEKRMGIHRRAQVPIGFVATQSSLPRHNLEEHNNIGEDMIAEETVFTYDVPLGFSSGKVIFVRPKTASEH